METESPPQSPKPIHSSVDTSRPFSSVKEAVAIFGERLISGEQYSYHPKPLFPTPRRHISLSSFSEIQPAADSSQNGESAIEDAVRRIQADLEQTKMELRILKMRESETEVILASLNAELHRSMSIIAKAEAVQAAMAMAAAKERETVGVGGGGMRETTLGQVLRFREEKRFSLETAKAPEKMNSKKKKPIVPLLLDFFSGKTKKKKKGSSPSGNPNSRTNDNKVRGRE